MCVCVCEIVIVVNDFAMCGERGVGGEDFSFQVSLNSDRDDKTSIKREREKKDLEGGRKEVETINTVNTKKERFT